MNKLCIIFVLCILFNGLASCDNRTGKAVKVDKNMAILLDYCTIEHRTKSGFEISYYYDYPRSCNHIYLHIVNGNQGKTWDESDIIKISSENYTIKENSVRVLNGEFSDTVCVKPDFDKYLSIIKRNLKLFNDMELRYLEYICNMDMLVLTTKDTNYFYLKDTAKYFGQFTGGKPPFRPEVIQIDTGFYKFKEYTPPY